MSNIFQNVKWQFGIDPVGSTFLMLLVITCLLFVVSVFLMPLPPASKPEGDDCTDIRQEHVLLNLNIDKNK